MIRPVILCGGAGTRLWPVSREQFPKQFIRLTGDRTLLQETVDRVSGERFTPALIVSGEEQRFLIEKQLEEAITDVAAVLLEPVARNTAAAAALAAAWSHSEGGDELLLLMPSDHVIGDRDAFLRAVDTGAAHALDGAIVTFGAQPTDPNTQYGYIEAQTEGQPGDGAFRIARFHEKPNAETASRYVASGQFYWNCGIFLAKVSTILQQMAKFLPETMDAVVAAVASATREGDFVRPSADLFGKADNISIDNAIMEKTTLGVVVPVQMAWSDVGAWDAVWKIGEKDNQGNVLEGNVAASGCNNSLLRNGGKAVLAASGLHGMTVIAEDDAIFVAPTERASEIKPLVAQLKQDHPDIVARPVNAPTPWGSEQTVEAAAQSHISRHVLEPGKCLMVDADESDGRHWVIVDGSLQLTRGTTVTTLCANESIAAPAGAVLTNSGARPAELLEIRIRR